MTTDDKIRNDKLQHDINREAAKISTLSSGKIDKYEYLIDEEILPSNQKQIIEQAAFTYYPLGKALEKHFRKQLVESNELIKKDFNIDRDSIPLEYKQTNKKSQTKNKTKQKMNLLKK